MNRMIAYKIIQSVSSTFTCLIFALFLTSPLAAQIGIASYQIPKSGDETQQAELRTGIVKSLTAGKFVDGHESLEQDSVVFIALESRSTLWKKSVSVYRDSNNVVTKATVVLPNSMNAFVSLVETSTGEVIRHRAPNVKDLVAEEDLNDPAVTAITQLAGNKLGQITLELSADELAKAPVLEKAAYDSIKYWAATALAPHVNLVRAQMVKGATKSLAEVVEVVVGPWKFDLNKSYRDFRFESKDGFLFEAPAGVQRESLVAALMQRSVGVQIPTVVIRFSGCTDNNDGRLKTTNALITTGLGLLKLDESAGTLSEEQMFLTADLAHFYEDSSADSERPVSISVTAYSLDQSIRDLSSTLAASKYVELQVQEIAKRFEEVGKTLASPSLEITYNGRRIELMSKGKSKPYSTPVSPTSTSRIVLRLLEYIPAHTRIVQGKMKKGKIKTGLITSPIPFTLIGSNGADVGIGSTYSTEAKALITYGAKDKQSMLATFRAFNGEEALFEAVESKTALWLLDRSR